MRFSFVLLLVGCKFSASSKVDGLDTADQYSGADPTGGGGLEDTGDGAGLDTGVDTGEYVDAEEWDNDSDGYTELEGDCDDDDPSIRPGASDVCDDIDNDCDDSVDEDAAGEDPYEPNDSIAWPLGETEKGEPLDAVGFVFDEEDVDMFKFEFGDGLGVDRLKIKLKDISPDIAYKFVVFNLDEEEEVDALFSTPEDESLTIEVDWSVLGDDSAEFQVTVSALSISPPGASGCTTPYTLSIVHEGLWHP